MLIAFDTACGVVVTGPESLPNIDPRSHETDGSRRLLTDGGVGTQRPTSPRSIHEHNLQRDDAGDAFGDGADTRYECVACGEPVVRNSVQTRETDHIEDVFKWFEHANGGADCFGDGSMGTSHRAAVELSAHRLARASHQLHGNWNSNDQTDALPRIEPEKRVTAPSNDQWIETDVHLSSPRIAVEVFCEISQLDLRRRLTVLFGARYDAYLVFDVDGRYDPGEIEVWLQDVATVPIRVGRFEKSRALSGDLSSLTLGTRLSKSVIDPSALTGSNVPVFLQ